MAETVERSHVHTVAWEWESGDGITFWGTHDEVQAHEWLRWVAEDIWGTPKEDFAEDVPDLTQLRSGSSKVWIKTKARDSEDPKDWKRYKHWLPGRTRVILFSF